MKKIIFRKLLSDCIVFFLISLISLSIIIWVFQAVNYLDIIIEDGRDYKIYLSYSLLNLPKIIGKIFPFAFFFSFAFIISKYELNNELLIFWNFGISKIRLVNFFFKVSILITFIQILLNAYLIPKAQILAKSILRNSNVNIFENFIKTKNFNDTIKGLTIYIENKNNDNELSNIYLKKQISLNDFQITYAKKGFFKKNASTQVLVLLDGETLSSNKKNLTNFSFSQTDYNLSNIESNTTTYVKTQELLTTALINCIINLTNFKHIKLKKFKVENCNEANIHNIYRELYKRIITPIYLLILILVSMLLILKSKEKINYTKYRIFVFSMGFATIIFSETSLRFINNTFFENLKILFIPIFLILIIYSYFIYTLNFKRIKK